MCKTQAFYFLSSTSQVNEEPWQRLHGGCSPRLMPGTQEDLLMPLISNSSPRLPSRARSHQQLPFGRHPCSKTFSSARARDRRRAGVPGRAQCSTVTNRKASSSSSKEAAKEPAPIPPAQVTIIPHTQCLDRLRPCLPAVHESCSTTSLTRFLHCRTSKAPSATCFSGYGKGCCAVCKPSSAPPSG